MFGSIATSPLFEHVKLQVSSEVRRKMSLESVLSSLQALSPEASLLRILSLFDLETPIDSNLLLQSSYPHITFPDLSWEFTDEAKMRTALDNLVQLGLCGLEEHHVLHLSRGKFKVADLRSEMNRFFWGTENEHEQIALLQSVIIFFAAVFPREPTKLLYWRLSRGLEKHFEAFLMRVWNDWRQKAPGLITEDYAICICALAEHSVAVDAPLVFSWCLQTATTIRSEYPDAFTTLVNIYYSFADADFCFTLREDRWSALEKTQTAIELLEANNALFSKPEIALFRHFLARVYTTLDKLPEARSVAAQCCELLGITLADLDTATQPNFKFSRDVPMYNVADLCRVLGSIARFGLKAAEAQRWYMIAMQLMLKCLGRDHPSTQRTAIFLAESILDRGVTGVTGSGIEDAEELLLNAQKYFTREFGPDHDMAIYCVQNLSEAYFEKGEYEKACESANDMYLKAKAAYGEKSPRTLRSLLYCAKIYRNCGYREKSFELALQIEGACREVLGTNDIRSVEAIADVARAAIAVDRYDIATPKAKEAMEIAERLFGPSHPHTAAAITILAHCLSVAGQLDEATKLLRRRLETCDKDDPDYISVIQNLASIYEKQDNIAEAEALYRRSVAMLESGEISDTKRKNLSLATSYSGLAAILAHRGAFVDAEANQRIALELYATLMPPNDIVILASYYSLASYIAAQLRNEEALKMIEDTLQKLEQGGHKSDALYQEFQDLRKALQVTIESEKSGFFQGGRQRKPSSKSSAAAGSGRRQNRRRNKDETVSTVALVAVSALAVVLSGVATVFFLKALRQQRQ